MLTVTDPEESFERFVSGDKQAFSQVIDYYRDGLIFFVHGYVRNMFTAVR